MSQEYTPVTWVDEEEGTPGTLINKARLDQMQTAHHYADGFEEVDTIPTADPGVDYHKIVYCTVDKQFYRWTGSAWEKDIDDDTKALLLAHEADHSNPHQVTKAQVGLGNCDNTSDADKPVSTAQQTALDAKVDDTQVVSAWQGTPDDTHIPTEKLTKDTIDGKVSGTGNIGSDTKPIKIVNGVATAVTNDLVDVSSAQTITGAKTIKGDITIGEVGTPTDVTQVGDLNIKGNITIEGNITQNGSAYETHAEKIYTTKDYIYLREGATGALSPGDYTGMEAEKYDGTNNGRLVFDSSGTARVGDVGDEAPLLTRDEAADLTDGDSLIWDAANSKAITAPIPSAIAAALTGKEDKITPTLTTIGLGQFGFTYGSVKKYKISDKLYLYTIDNALHNTAGNYLIDTTITTSYTILAPLVSGGNTTGSISVGTQGVTISTVAGGSWLFGSLLVVLL